MDIITPSATLTLTPTPTTLPRFGSRTASSTTSSVFPGSSDYPVFPNGVFLSKFYLVSSQYSGLNDLDHHLYNVCYLPFNPFDVEKSFDIDKRRASPTGSSSTPRPTYLINEAPCKRQAAINTNCHFQNTNGSISGLLPYSDQFDVQQQCYCEKYPFFDSVLGCMKCFEKHGGIEGYHWFPQSYVDAAWKAYCGPEPPTVEFYKYMSQWANTDPAANVPSTTASTVLGTQTDASLYYTYATTIRSPKNGAPGKALSLRGVLLAALAAGVVLCQ
ncbi:uncharacterized protein GIQ15_02859 [Arthroderma uncinatum]|uniref:uncharacterized protein n=1 Tax=Arthroderma uncinatum TaxID=74035 RepID=UPI00144A8E3A|nr:uncharacterized protein GIQ15_02859 [Arthroderma uncinatum]KAF3483535.1 hypothetical protein GIQ15_02859 [Arthroderma uncinatum]